MIARWKPVHLGHAAILRALREHASDLTIGIGSSNKLDRDNPFTPEETEEMIRLVIEPDRILPIPDLGNGPKWREMVLGLLGPLDVFVTANDYVKSLLERDYTVQHPLQWIPKHDRVRVDGTMVRAAIRSQQDWESLVPAAIARYLKEHDLLQRVCATTS